MTLLDNNLHSIQVLCMDCGKKINIPGTGEHHCSNQQKPQLPTLCSSTSSYSNDSSDDDQPSESLYTTKKLPKVPKKPVENGIWSFFRSNHVKPVEQRMNDEPSVYYDTYTAQLSAAKINPRRASRVRENEKWKDLSDEKKKGKLWDKWFQSSETASNVDTCEDDSDQEDWEGETHVSRILREYHQTKHQALPEWLINDGLPASSLTRGSALYKPRSHKLWEVDVKMTPRERDRLALRHDEQARRKSENNVQSRMKAKDHSYNLNMIRKTHTFQSSIL